MPKEISLIFPGQGSQHIGMLTPDLLLNYKDIVTKSSDLLSINFIELINEDPNNLLNQSSFTQPAILLISYLHFLNFKNTTNLNPILMSGHSLGEYSALVASNSIDFFETLELVRRRGMRRSHDSLTASTLSTDQVTGERHVRHQMTAEGLYKGRLVKDLRKPIKEDEDKIEE